MSISDEFMDKVNSTNKVFGTLIFREENIENIIRLYRIEAEKNGLSINLPAWNRIEDNRKFHLTDSLNRFKDRWQPFFTEIHDENIPTEEKELVFYKNLRRFLSGYDGWGVHFNGRFNGIEFNFENNTLVGRFENTIDNFYIDLD